MSLRSIETKHIITKGFRNENIKNPFIYGMAEKNSFSLGNTIKESTYFLSSFAPAKAFCIRS